MNETTDSALTIRELQICTIIIRTEYDGEYIYIYYCYMCRRVYLPLAECTDVCGFVYTVIVCACIPRIR